MNKLRYTVDLRHVELSETADGTGQTWLQIMPLGVWDHPLHGKINITQNRVERFVKNFNDNVREIDLDIDYDHKEFDTKAAGWIKELADKGQDGLWALIEWTASAWRSLRDREFRYFSPEFVDEWEHPRTHQKFKDVLFGGAITNRPFLKGILPINLSELGLPFNQGVLMNEQLRQFAELLGVTLSEEDNDETAGEKINAAVKKLQEKPAQPVVSAKEEEDAELKKLAESNPTIAKILARNEKKEQRLSVLESANRLSETSMRLAECKSEKYALPPSFADALRPILAKVPVKLAEGVFTALGELVKSGLVPMGATPPASNRNREETGATVQRFHDEIAKLTKGEDALSYSDACLQVATENPELWDAYNDAQLISVQDAGGSD